MNTIQKTENSYGPNISLDDFDALMDEAAGNPRPTPKLTGYGPVARPRWDRLDDDGKPPINSKKENKEPELTGEQELAQLIGMENAKRTAATFINAIALQKARIADGLPTTSMTMHCLFIGEAGVGKTTLARIMGKIMKERQILPKGTFIEVGRADLVGEYVGHTAPRVREAFQRAKGGVLFIDEAYSLTVGQPPDCFGQEAVATIVQEMENNRLDTMVILAGYEAEMQQFMESNSGLRSRVSHNLHCDSYSADELYAIAKLMLNQQMYLLTAAAETALKELLVRLAPHKNNGNGRMVRNLIDYASGQLANRLAGQDLALLTKSQKSTIEAGDFQGFESTLGTVDKRNPIGFGIVS